MGVDIIKTIPERCVQCYACVRNCPVKAVAIVNGKVRVIQERCIQCGNCVKICSQNAKHILSGVDTTLSLLENKSPVALVAPSFPAAFAGSWNKISAALRSIGFSQVWEVAVGAELVVQAYQEMNLPGTPHISSACPGVVNLIERHYPQFLPYLIPLVSPAVAAARFIRSLYPGQELCMVFIGPCLAKKGEIRSEAVEDEIQEAITYLELEEIFSQRKVIWDELEPEPFDGPSVSLAYTFPLSAGLLRNLNQANDLLREDCVVVDEYKGWKDTLEVLEQETIPLELVDGLLCKGCIDGPAMNGRDNILARKNAILKYMKAIPIERQAQGKRELMKCQIDLHRSFTNRKVDLSQPSEDQIREVLRQTKKEDPEAQLNCGACGYSSCREKAIAVYQGIAEQEMCLPYLLSQKNELVQSLNQELKRVKQLKDELDVLIDASYDGICMTDGQGNIQRVNKQLQNLLGLKEEELVHRNMMDLETEKIMFPSATMMALKAKKVVTFLQQLRSGKRVLATGNPVMDEEKNVTRVIANIRDFDQLQKIKDELELEHAVYKPQKMEQLDKENPVIALSREFTRVLDMASRVSIVDTTVLILGESGVGKEIIARYIHQHSGRAQGPFIKINCGTLPETLIESELFGYETGAFTGARRQGKPGLFELADKGTIFLDEIGELPLSQQVKLLQVLQEKQITRIGGTKPQKVDIRLLAATNRDLSTMVKEGGFRADLFYRLNVVPIKIPSLRERKDDIIPLMYFFLERFNERYHKQCRVSKEVKDIFLEYQWPGNVRELENMMERLVVIAEKNAIDTEDLPPGLYQRNQDSQDIMVKGILPLRKALDEVERQLLLRARELYHTTYEMAEALEVNQSTIVRKLKKYTEDAEENH